MIHWSPYHPKRDAYSDVIRGKVIYLSLPCESAYLVFNELSACFSVKACYQRRWSEYTLSSMSKGIKYPLVPANDLWWQGFNFGSWYLYDSSLFCYAKMLNISCLEQFMREYPECFLSQYTLKSVCLLLSLVGLRESPGKPCLEKSHRPLSYYMQLGFFVLLWQWRKLIFQRYLCNKNTCIDNFSMK